MSQTNAILGLVSSTRGSALRVGLIALNDAYLTGQQRRDARGSLQGAVHVVAASTDGNAVWTRIVQEADGANATQIKMGAADTTNHVYRVALDRDEDSYIAATSTDDQIEVVTGGTRRALFDNSGLTLGAADTAESLRIAAAVPIKLGIGTTTQRPNSPENGLLWVNDTLDRLEAYINGAWVQFAITTDGRGDVSDLADVNITGVPTDGEGLVWDGPSGKWVNRGVSVTDGAITTAKLADGAVTTPKIADDAVTSAKIADDAIGNAQLKDSAVSTDTMANGAITLTKISATGAAAGKVLKIAANGTALVWADDQQGTGGGGGTPADGSITTAKLANGAVTNAKLATDAVTPVKISAAGGSNGQVLGISGGDVAWITVTSGTGTPADGSITTAKLADGSVTTVKLADLAVTAAKIAANAVTGAKIQSNAVTGAKIADGAVASGKLAADSVTSAKIANDAVGLNALNTDNTGASGNVLQRTTGGLTWATPSQASVADNSITAAKLAVSGNGTNGQVLASDGDGTFSWVAQSSGGGGGGSAAWGSLTPVTANGSSGALAFDSGIPAGAGYIKLVYLGVPGNQYFMRMRVGSSGGYKTTGYTEDGASQTTYFSSGQMNRNTYFTLVHVGGNTWEMSRGTGNAASEDVFEGRVTLDGTLDRIQIYLASGNITSGAKIFLAYGAGSTGSGGGASDLDDLSDVTLSNTTTGQALVATGTNTWGNATLSIPVKADETDLSRGSNDTDFVTPLGVVRMLEETFDGGESWDLAWNASGGQLGASLSTGQIAAEPGQSYQYNLKASDADEDEMDTRFHRGAKIRLQTDASNYVGGRILWAAHDADNNLFSFAISATGRTNAGSLSGTVTVTAEGAHYANVHDNFVDYRDINATGGIVKGARAADGTFDLSTRFASAQEVIKGNQSDHSVSPATLASWDTREQLRITLTGYTARTSASSMPAGSFYADTTNERLYIQPTNADRIRIAAAFSDSNDNGRGMRASAEGGNGNILSGVINAVSGGSGSSPFQINLATPSDYAGTLGANTQIFIEGERAYDHRTSMLADSLVTGRMLKGIDPGETGDVVLNTDGTFGTATRADALEKATQDDARKLTDDAKYMTPLRTKDAMEWFIHSWTTNQTFAPTTTANNPPDNSFRGTAPNAQGQSILYIRGSTANLAELRDALEAARGLEMLNGANILRGDILTVTENTSLGSSANPVFQIQVANHFGSGSLTAAGGWSLSVRAEGIEELVDNLPKRSVALSAIDGQVTNSGKHLAVGTTGFVEAVDAPSGGTPGDGSITTAKLADGAVTSAKIASGVIRERDQFMSGKMRGNGVSGGSITSNASTRFSDSASGAKRLWAIPASGTGSFVKMTNGSQVPGAQQYVCVRANSGGLYNIRMDGIGVLYCGKISSDTDAAQRRLFGLEVGLQFAWKLPTSNTWSSWLDCYVNQDQTASVNGSNQTIYDVSGYLGGPGLAGRHRVRQRIDPTSGSARSSRRSSWPTTTSATTTTPTWRRRSSRTSASERASCSPSRDWTTGSASSSRP